MKQEDVKNQALEQELSSEELEGAAGGRMGEPTHTTLKQDQ